MNQNLLAAIGNVYSDKIHFQARLHPETRVAHLDGSTLEELHKEIWRVLETAIEREADPHKLRGSFLLSYRHEGERCPLGNGESRKSKTAGRTVYYCPACQPKAR
jgi:formamidopyrimidine-DNA glycosylase